MLYQIVVNLGTTQALQTAAKVRLATLPNPGTWHQQTANLNLAVLLYERLQSGPGLESLEDELFSLLIKHCLSAQSIREWLKRMRAALSQSETFTRAPATSGMQEPP